MTELTFLLEDGWRKYAVEDLGKFELINILHSGEFKGDNEPIRIPNVNIKDFDEFMTRVHQGLSVMPNHYSIADFLQYEYTPSLWRSDELQGFLKKAADQSKKRDDLIETICLYIKQHSEIDANNYLTCAFSGEMFKQMFDDKVVEKGVRRRLREVFGSSPVLTTAGSPTRFTSMKVKLKG